jgi:F-type H+-transporting ATPase subunit a
MFSPLDQFEIRDLIVLNLPILNNMHISLTNIAAYIFISFIILVTYNAMTNKNIEILPKY